MSSPQPAWTAVIPLRAGSKGLPGKNTRMLAGKPLYRHAIDQALEAGAARVLITTDIAELKAATFPAQVEVIERPIELATDAVPMAPVLLHALSAAGCVGVVVLLQATSPLRRASYIRVALAAYQRGDHELVMSVTQADRGVLKWGRLDGDRFHPLSDPAHCFANRQSLPPVVRPNGAIYVLDAAWFAARGSFVSDRIGVVEMDAQRSLDIDTQADFERCEAALAAQALGAFQGSAS
jgi:CMP-N-acetylneuraminic acid synthetase